jgi:metal-responsive CopG/Arc/MetJ family transcriptional regulator
MSILNFIQHQKAVNEASLATYYNNADKSTKTIAKKVDDLLKAVFTDKKKLEEITDLITDLNDAYAEERIDSQKMDEAAITEAVYVKGDKKELKDLNYTLTNLQKIYNISNQDMQATVDQIQAIIDNSNKKR